MSKAWRKIVRITTASEVSIFGVFLVRIFPHSSWIRRDTEYLFVFSPNTGKYRRENSEYTVYFAINIILQSVSRQCSHLFRFFPVFCSGCIWNTLKHWYEMVESKKYYPERGKSLPISKSYWMWRLNYINTSVLHPPLPKEQNTYPNTACITQTKMSE